MHSIIVFAVTLLGLASLGSAQIVQAGQCSEINLMQNFVLNTFATGTWYEIGKSSTQNADCSNLQFTINTDNTISVSNPSVVNNFLQSATGTATHTTGTAQLSLTLSSSTTPIDFWILGSDYNNYAIAVNCVDTSATQRQLNVWQLGRAVNSYETATTLTAANNLLNTISLSVADLQAIDHSTAACTQLPVIPDGQPVILDGLCAANAPTPIANFDVANFAGTWHEISSYYSVNAVGTCARADYTLVGTTVNVVNSQVLNQRLDQITGTATLIGTDGSGRLSVTLDVFGVPVNQELLVLSTDYNEYAISYTCVDISATQRQVNSWILSRTRQISAASQTAVNNFIASVVDLNTAYYRLTDQSDNGCFYFPQHQAGQPVIFPGDCDNAIAAMPNFDLTQFIGTWHEVEAYPKEQQTGSCVNHAFSTGTANSLNLVSNQVVEQQATTASGSVTLVSNDGSGRLTLVLTTAGQTIEIPYWILSTDYNSYALAYSCVNQINNGINERAVYSWKLSRTQALTAAANTAINTAMAAVQVLNQDYFETIDQTENGCFYYPALVEGNPIVFPGLCDSSIPVQQNFDPVAYMGLWHDIESYPSTFQQGTCNNAHYTLVGGIVDVFNTQVINQRLDTINGTAVIPDPNEPAKLLVSFPIADTDLTATTDYWVLSTDYSTYSLVYSCTNLPETNERLVFGWKLSRDKAGLSAAANTAINAIIANIPVLDDRYFVTKDQSATGCFYFPEALDQPVVFPGECSNTINAAPNFVLAAFTGTWHEVEAYPKEQQSGTCVNHVFSSNTIFSLNLVSNQVISQMFSSSSGTVTLASTDGSARLALSMNVDGHVIEFPYWILATDYQSYALAYSCIQLNEDYRAVYSWKLSRTQTLTAAAVTAINAAMTAVDVVDQQYFDPIDQSADGCRAYPNIPAGDPIIFEGQCGTVTPVANFQSDQFSGTWHEAARFASARQTGNCAASQFTSTAANTFTLTQTIVYNERQTVVSGTATLAADGSGTLTATLTDGADLTYTTTIHILDTDYNDFALLYSCENVQGNNRQIFSWKLSRSQAGLSQSANERINQVVAANDDLFEGYYQPTGQTNFDCFYYPVFEETPEAIVLPGTCPPVAGVANFNPTNYIGHWYDVARYPIATQFGTCSRAEYSLVDGVITIRNLMVVDGELREQNGIGRLSVTGTGLLQVTFVLENGEESVAQYFILGTDYTSYSLLYSCRNLADGTRLVHSWKLSRTPTLSAEANTAINTIVGNTQGLIEEYYQAQSHTDQDCFYLPEPVPGEPVLFRGICPLMSGMAGFVASQYFGLWHEIERYNSDRYTGQCSSVDFELNTGLVAITEVSVSNGVANETVTSGAINNANGVIAITRPGQGTETWYVIDTDYETYSLLIACEDVVLPSGFYRRIWSAKHSRQRSLTEASQNAMAPHIEANPNLYPQFYETVDQSASACFHYREDAGEQVILPGQCDTTIPVQADFDVNQFAGTWYQIERYPYPQVSNDGTCVGARYTVDGDGVTVLNWEVLEGSLNTREGTATVNGATLTVTLPVDGSEETVTTNLHILSTDYDNYALAYTCVNVDLYNRAVGAFKLSRTRQLNNNAQYAIETYMATREELHQPYFISISHNDDCEEPSSALLVKSSIIVMLVCVVLQLVT